MPLSPQRSEQIEQLRDAMASLGAAASLHGISTGIYGLEGECEHCDGPLPPQTHQGNPRVWCSESCRLRAYRARRHREPSSG